MLVRRRAVPSSVFGRLRSKVVQSLKIDGSGVNPFWILSGRH